MSLCANYFVELEQTRKEGRKLMQKALAAYQSGTMGLNLQYPECNHKELN
jgi:hypothetical protein